MLSKQSGGFLSTGVAGELKRASADLLTRSCGCTDARYTMALRSRKSCGGVIPSSPLSQTVPRQHRNLVIVLFQSNGSEYFASFKRLKYDERFLAVPGQYLRLSWPSTAEVPGRGRAELLSQSASAGAAPVEAEY